MNLAKSLVSMGIVLVLGTGTQARAQEPEEDSVYQWGRWAVLSPAAGGEPFAAPLTPDAANNARPGEADEFQPELAGIDVAPPVELQPPVAVEGPAPIGDPRGEVSPTPPVATPGDPPSGSPR